ncbi:hypothetical protein GCM10027022_18590 [Alpinimonas psychrophila]|uniref:Uncharacterized protein n=1 Tax=Alpinimonas psychrophila TaxID=748908 RepID=A0A7W3JUS8_9MICO|nr:hypothetical protein [Alpinimonas psychrophila]MBA8829572.1 hypothetical protein [Alpinimonas psychrophila]
MFAQEAMKLRANRPGRDTRDIRLLFSLCHISTLEGAEDLYEEFYPGDVLTQRAVSIVTAILADGPPDAPDVPEPLAL